MRLLNTLKRHRTLAGGVAILAVTQFLASVAGLVRDNLLARVFEHNLGVVDAYIAAFRPSDLLFQTCIMSAMGTVLVPILAGYKAKGEEDEMGKVLSGTIGMASLVFGIIALILGIFFPLLAPLFVRFQGEQLRLYITFGQLALLVNFLFVAGNAAGQYLITVQRYWMYGITPILYTAGTIVGTILLVPMFGPLAPMIGTMGGALVYVILRFISVWRAGTRIRFSFWHPELPDMGRLMIPRILSLGAFQIQLLFLDGLASGFAQGSVTINNYTRNFQSVLVGVVGIAVAQSVYSLLSQAAARNDRGAFWRYFNHGLVLCLLLTVPGAVALVMLAPIAARLVHLQNFYHPFFVCLAIYAISIPFESLSHLQYRAFYAFKDTLLPSVFGALGGGVAIITGFALAPTYGLYSIAIGFTLGEVVQTIGLAIALPWKARRVMKEET